MGPKIFSGKGCTLFQRLSQLLGTVLSCPYLHTSFDCLDLCRRKRHCIFLGLTVWIRATIWSYKWFRFNHWLHLWEYKKNDLFQNPHSIWRYTKIIIKERIVQEWTADILTSILTSELSFCFCAFSGGFSVSKRKGGTGFIVGVLSSICTLWLGKLARRWSSFRKVSFQSIE